MQATLRGFGAERFGVMDDWAAGEVLLQFTHRGRNVSMRASSKGYAAAWLKGQVTAIEVGLLTFDTAFLPNLVTPNGETIMQRIQRTDLLALPSPGG